MTSNDDVPPARIPKLLGHDHSELDELLGAFFAAVEKGDLDQSFDTLDVFWARLAVHIRTEHLHLFPTLIAAVENPSSARKTAAARLRLRPHETQSLASARTTISSCRNWRRQ